MTSYCHSAFGCDCATDLERIKQIVLRSWDDHMASFELMDPADEEWLLRWAEHPSASDD